MQERCWEFVISKEDRGKIIRIILPTLAVLLATGVIESLSVFKTLYENIVFRKVFFTCLPLLISISALRTRKVLLASSEQPKIKHLCKCLNQMFYGCLVIAVVVLLFA